MARPYQPKYYPQPKTGTGHIWLNPKTGKKIECQGVEWYLDFKDATGKRQRRKVHKGYCICPKRQRGICPHEQLAKEALAAVISQPVPIEKTLDQARVDLSIERFTAMHLLGIERSRSHAPRSKQIIVLSIETFLKFCKRNDLTELDQIKRQHIEAFRDELMERKHSSGMPWKSRTTNRYLGDVRAMLNKAIRRRIITHNVAKSEGRNDDLYLPEDDSKPMTLLTGGELAILMNLTDDDLEPLFRKNYQVIREMMVMYYKTGLRLGELCNLTVLQVRNGAIYIEPHDDWTPKWGIRRQVPVNDEVAKIIEGRQEKKPNGKYIFETALGSRFEERNIRDDIAKVFQKYNIVGDTGEGASTHSFRHTFATTCLISGVPVTTVADWLGHTNIDMTMRYYHHIKAQTDTQMRRVEFVS